MNETDPKEAIKFYKTQLNRCKINLQGAQDRGDQRAVENIRHKMAIYEFTIERIQDMAGGT